MLQIYAYQLKPTQEQVIKLMGLHHDYAALCSRVADVVRSLVKGNTLPSDKEVNEKIGGMSEFRETVNVGDEGDEVLVRRIPARYVALAINRIQKDMSNNRYISYTGTDPVNIDCDLCTPKVNKIDEPFRMSVTVKCFGSAKNTREDVTCTSVGVTDDFSHLKAGQAILVQDITESGGIITAIWRLVTAVENPEA